MTLVVHVMLEIPQALQPERDSYCFGEHRPYRTVPTPSAALARYDAQLEALGPVSDRFGYGAWSVGARGPAEVAFEPVDHVFVTARATAVAHLLPALL